METDHDQSIYTNELKQFLSAKLYQNLAEIHSHIENQSSTAVATDILLTALGVNIGHIVGQLPPEKQKKCLRALRKIIDEQIASFSKIEALFTHGQIGHA